MAFPQAHSDSFCYFTCSEPSIFEEMLLENLILAAKSTPSMVAFYSNYILETFSKKCTIHII